MHWQWQPDIQIILITFRKHSYRLQCIYLFMRTPISYSSPSFTCVVIQLLGGGWDKLRLLTLPVIWNIDIDGLRNRRLFGVGEMMVTEDWNIGLVEWLWSPIGSVEKWGDHTPRKWTHRMDTSVTSLALDFHLLCDECSTAIRPTTHCLKQFRSKNELELEYRIPIIIGPRHEQTSQPLWIHQAQVFQ